jgi:hypothetical protein
MTNGKNSMTNGTGSMTKPPAFCASNLVLGICLVLVSCLLVIPRAARAGDKADFILTGTFPHAFVGFGAQMNPYLYCSPNWPGEVNERNVKVLEDEVVALHPQHVRMFMLANWWDKENDEEVARRDPRVLQSFYRTLALAQRAGATVNLTLWYGPFNDPIANGKHFAELLDEIIRRRGMTCVQYVTIQNEVNLEGHWLPMCNYNLLYRALDEELRRRGLRDRITIVGGDLVGMNQGIWFNDLSNFLGDACDAYSIHIYWDYWDPEKLSRRLSEVPPIVARLRPSGQKPLMVTEFGVRGHRYGNEEPGAYRDGRNITDTALAAMQAVQFDLEAINLGYTATVQWDMYDAWYDRKMGYGVIGSVETNWEKRRGYYALQLLTHTARVGWHGVKVIGDVPEITAAAMGDAGKTGVIYLLNSGEDLKSVLLGGVPRSTLFSSQVWAAHGGRACIAPPLRSDERETLQVSLRPEILTAITWPVSK